MNWSVSVDNGKYEVDYIDGKLTAYRHGEPWRDCTGDNLVYWLAVELAEAREELEELKYRLEGLYK